LGSDYPFPLGDLEIGKFIAESDLDKDAIIDIFSNSTLEWLNLDAKFFI
jgi:aminocarboxymuconate-semialdehyde decarboxylase